VTDIHMCIYRTRSRSNRNPAHKPGGIKYFIFIFNSTPRICLVLPPRKSGK